MKRSYSGQLSFSAMHFWIKQFFKEIRYQIDIPTKQPLISLSDILKCARLNVNGADFFNLLHEVLLLYLVCIVTNFPTKERFLCICMYSMSRWPDLSLSY